MHELVYKNQSVSLNYFEGPKNGKPILLLHGNMGRWQAFDSIIDKLAQTRQVFAIDLRGHGKSSHVPQSYLLDNHFADVTLFIKEIIKEPVTLVGYSLGGMIALMIAAHHPELVKRLVVLDSPLTLKTLTPIIQSQKQFGEMLLHYRRTDQIAKLQQDMNHDPSSIGISVCDPNVIDITINQHEKMLGGFDIKQMIPLITCPFLLLRGEIQLGSMISDDDIELVKELSPQVNEKKIYGIGHSMLSDQQVIATLLEELALA